MAHQPNRGKACTITFQLAVDKRTNGLGAIINLIKTTVLAATLTYKAMYILVCRMPDQLEVASFIQQLKRNHKTDEPVEI